jgi:alkyl hydroperoxide reductase subunit F
MENKFDLVIIGGAPAGAAAAVYAARKQLKTVIIAGEFGGQSVVSDDIQNWIGTPHISGADLAKSLKAHVMEYAGEILTVKEGSLVTAISGTAGNFSVTTSKNETFQTRSVLIASGSNRRKIEIPGAAEFENKGLTYCASCDGPLFSGEDVIVIGGGNAAFETAAQLLAYCKSVTLLNRSASFRADEITVSQTIKNPKFKAITEIEMIDVFGGDFVEGMTIKHKASGEVEKIPGKAVFVEVGQIPNSGYVKDFVEQNEVGSIKIDPRTQATSVPGIWAAGDVTDVLYHQNNIAAGDAVRALEDIYIWLHKNSH